MSESLDLTPEAATRKLKELTQQKKRVEQSIQQTGINPLYMAGLPEPTVQNFNNLRSQLNTVNEEISQVIEWFDLHLLERLEASTNALNLLTKNSLSLLEKLETSTQRLNRLTIVLIIVTLILALLGAIRTI